ncbi:hypothetical protein HMI54_002780 [Coelomomyces lativittatus]|nr:hypothetical protein HMI55_002685 [Coelomomyces lativittatus]KAJ1508951.1 hypothetical protein HMI54_002780 [Coelomomyces lativittatus]KAJ1512211.1 hypothetical protein HMI56_004362 [Coelomomyces lativittatus]
MSERTSLGSNSPQFAYLEYFLQLSLFASSARIISAYALSNPHLTVNFEKRCKGILTLDAWVDPSRLPASNSEEDVLRRGFTFNTVTPGFTISVGALKKPSEYRDEKQLCRAILCKVGVGRAFPHSGDPSGLASDSIPESYDSLYVPDLTRDTDFNHDLTEQVNEEDGHRHHYYITNTAQILPMYLVQYEFDPIKEKRLREKPYCDNCENAIAEFYCASDLANLCKACDLQLHSSNKLASRHVRTPIGKGADVFGTCRHHPEKLVEFFCSTCHIPVCVHCKMVGHHCSGEAALHKLVSVSEAYHSVMAESQLTDNILLSRKQAIGNQLQCLSTRARNLEKHVLQIQQHIEDICKRALNDLQQIAHKKRSVLEGDQWELRRQLDEMHRLGSFLSYQQEGDATHFLFSWARHQQMRHELHDFKFFRDHIDVQLDIKCSGTIAVLVDAAPSPSPKKSPIRSKADSRKGTGGLVGSVVVNASSPRKHPDFFSEALGALDELAHSGAAGHQNSSEYASEFSFAEGEGYISD